MADEIDELFQIETKIMIRVRCAPLFHLDLAEEASKCDKELSKIAITKGNHVFDVQKEIEKSFENNKGFIEPEQKRKRCPEVKF